MIPYEQYQKFAQMEAGVLARFDKLRRRMVEVNTRYSEEEVEKDVREAKAIFRSRKH